MKTFLIAVLFSISFVAIPQAEDQFQEANTLYNDGKYQEAIDQYLKILETGQHSTSLYYNLGNAYYKLNQVAPSIYYYEKALQLTPNDADVKNNLLFAQNMTIDAIEVMPQTGISKIFENNVNRFSYHTWAILSIVFMFFFVIGFLMYYFSIAQRKKRLFFSTGLLSLAICGLSFTFAHYQYKKKSQEQPAIIFEKEASVRSEPNARSEEIFLLHEGTKVEVQDTLGEWKKIRLADGKIGWMPSKNLREIKDF